MIRPLAAEYPVPYYLKIIFNGAFTFFFASVNLQARGYFIVP